MRSRGAPTARRSRSAWCSRRAWRSVEAWRRPGSPARTDAAAVLARTRGRRHASADRRDHWRRSAWTRSSTAGVRFVLLRDGGRPCGRRRRGRRRAAGDVAGDGSDGMKVLFLFGPNLGALGRRDPETYGTETLEQIMSEVEERATTLGHEIAWRQSDHEGDLVGWLLAAGGRRARRGRHQPGSAVPLLVRGARRDRGLRASGHRGAHVQHRRPRGVPPALGGLRGVPGDDHRSRGRWLSSGAGGDAVDHHLRRTTLSERLRRPRGRRVPRDRAHERAVPDRLHRFERAGPRRARRGSRVLHRRPIHRAVAS